MREGHEGRNDIALLVGLIIGGDIVVAEFGTGCRKTGGDEFDRLNQAPLDNVIILIHAESKRFAMQCFFFNVVVDEAFQIIARHAIESCCGNFRLKRL